MNNDYSDIRSRIPEPPVWWDETGVPRYCAFSPNETADIYARECVLMEIRCQNCERAFQVAMSHSRSSELLHGATSLARLIETNEIHYGDPPNIDCCPSGPTMNSVPVRVLEYWALDAQHSWVRDPAFERAIHCDWMEDT